MPVICVLWNPCHGVGLDGILLLLELYWRQHGDANDTVQVIRMINPN